MITVMKNMIAVIRKNDYSDDHRNHKLNHRNQFTPLDRKHLKGFLKNRKGQSTMIEYVVFVVCLILALIAMQAYIKRGIQGRLRASADSIGSHYEPTKTSSDFTITSRSNITTISTVLIDVDADTVNTETIVTTNYDEQGRTGTETVGAF